MAAAVSLTFIIVTTVCLPHVVNGWPAYTEALPEDYSRFQFEDVLTEAQKSTYERWRSEAENNRTLRLDSNNNLTITFFLCTRPNGTDTVDIGLHKIKYSNDGPADKINVNFNGTNFATFKTHNFSESGDYWNKIYKAERLNSTYLYLPEGKHAVEITVETDKWGIELDVICLLALNQREDQKLFCGATLS